MDKYLPPLAIVDFYDHISVFYRAAKREGAINARDSMLADDLDVTAAEYVHFWAVVRRCCSLAMTALAPQRLGSTSERIAASDQAIKQLEKHGELAANIIRNAEQSSPGSFLIAVTESQGFSIRQHLRDKLLGINHVEP